MTVQFSAHQMCWISTRAHPLSGSGVASGRSPSGIGFLLAFGALIQPDVSAHEVAPEQASAGLVRRLHRFSTGEGGLLQLEMLSDSAQSSYGRAMPSRATPRNAPSDKSDAIDLDVGNRIRAYRKLAGLSQTDLGDEIGVSFQQVQKYESGTNRVSASMLCHIADALHCPPADLLPATASGSEAAALNAAYTLLAMPGGHELVKAIAGLPRWAYEAVSALVLQMTENTPTGRG